MEEQMELQLDYGDEERELLRTRPFARDCKHGNHGYDPYDRYCFYCGYDRGPKKNRRLIAELELTGTWHNVMLAQRLRRESE